MTRSRIGLPIALVVGVALCISLPIHAAPPCNADLDDNGAVGASDLLILLVSWGPCAECPADFDGNGSVGASDLLVLLTGWGPTVFDFGPPLDDPEAEQIALEMLGPSGRLRPELADYNRIITYQALIRAADKRLLDQTHSPAWVANQMIVQREEGEPQQDYLCLNEFYQVTNESHLFSNWYLLTFADDLNIPALTGIYMDAASVLFAEPNGIIGGQNFWEATKLKGGLWRWDIDDGWLDCFDGCDCHRVYVIETDAKGNVEIISIEEWGQPWCDFGG
jgi:hypothetical protein